MPGGGRHGSLVKMLSNSMALNPVLLFLAIWATFAAQVQAAEAATTTASATGATSTFVPACAQGCLQAFMDVNGFTESCGKAPALDCLCARYSGSGATVGEGAVQCIVAEASRGKCSKDDTTQTALSKAYRMCNDQSGAVAPTQKTIVATLVTPTATSSPTPTTPITTSQSPTSTNTPSAGTSDQSNQPSAALSGGQVAGVTIGAVSGVFVLVAFVFVARCARRKRLNNLAMKDRNMSFDSESTAPGGGRGVESRDSMKISPPMHLAVGPDVWAPKPYESIAAASPPRLSTIGQALSPEGNTATLPSREPSAMQPTDAAPALKKRDSLEFFASLAHGQTSEPLARQQSSGSAKPHLSIAIPTNPVQATRDSQVTEFAEDGEDADPEMTGANIWRPPPSDPTSASTYYVADKWGNWRRKSVSTPRRDPDVPYGQMTSKSASSATVPPLNLGGRRAPAAGAEATLSATSSVYSAYTPPPSEWPGPDNPMPPLPPFPKSSYARMLEMNRMLESTTTTAATPPMADEPIGARSAWAARGSHTTATTIDDDDDDMDLGSSRRSTAAPGGPPPTSSLGRSLTGRGGAPPPPRPTRGPDPGSPSSSALLAKRLGADRAAAVPALQPRDQDAAAPRWARHPGPSTTAPPLPSTPGWEPRLMPSRRGDDLFLDVA